MPVVTKTININTGGFSDIHNLTPDIRNKLVDSSLTNGTVTIFVPGATAGITTLEFESGAIQDLKGAIERLVPMNADYQHNLRWNDGNGFSHVRAALLGPSLSVPFLRGKIVLGTWQQIILIDFDNGPRSREVILQFMGE